MGLITWSQQGGRAPAPAAVPGTASQDKPGVHSSIFSPSDRKVTLLLLHTFRGRSLSRLQRKLTGCWLGMWFRDWWLLPQLSLGCLVLQGEESRTRDVGVASPFWEVPVAPGTH